MQPALDFPSFTRPLVRRIRTAERESALVSDALLVSLIFLAWRVALILVTYAGSRFVPLVANGGPGAVGEGRSFDYWRSWAQWDGGWFIQIATEGYGPRTQAWFPVYPTLIRVLGWVTGDVVVAGLLISNLAFLTFLLVLHRLVKDRSGSGVAMSSVITVLTFPTAFYGVAMYSESLLLLMAALTLLSLERERLVAGSLFAGIAAGTRLVGIATFLPLALFALRRWDQRPRTAAVYVVAAVICLAPLAAWCLFLWERHGDPFYFQTVSSVSWGREPGNPLTTLADFIRHPDDPNSSTPLIPALELGLPLLFIAVLALGVRTIPLSWWLYSVAAVVIPLSSGVLFSMPRYVLASIGAFVIIAVYVQPRPALKYGVWTAGLVLQAVLAIRFINGYWVA
ncbi:MAG: mannosyltransferase family protein [Dehalococcoidia bacterium]